MLITGLEPVTSDVSGRLSNQLIYMSVFVGEEGLEPQIPFSITAFQEQLLILPDVFLIVVPQGFEPRFHGPKPCVLPIRRGNRIKPICQRTFSFEVPVRFELTTPGYKAGVLPNYTKEPNFLGIKKPEIFGLGFYIPFIMLVKRF